MHLMVFENETQFLEMTVIRIILLALIFTKNNVFRPDETQDCGSNSSLY